MVPVKAIPSDHRLDTAELLSIQLQRAEKELYELKTQFNKLVEEDRQRVDKLLNDINGKLNAYFEQLKAAGAFIAENKFIPKIRVFDIQNPIKPSIIEYGEIHIPDLHIKFIKGEKEMSWNE